MRTHPYSFIAIGLALGLMQSCTKNKNAAPQATVNHNLTTESVVSSYGTFYLTNVGSTQAMEVISTYMLTDGGAIQQDPYAGTGTATAPNQKWIVIQQGTGAITSTTKFKIMNVASGKYLEVPLAGTTPGTQLWQDKTNTNNAQLWYIQTSGTGSYKIVNVGNGLVVADHNGSATNGAPITQETYVSGNTSQQWVLNSITSEAYRDDAVVNFFHRPNTTNTTVAFDQGNSIPLSYSSNSGKSIWVTGDCFDANQMQANGQLYCQIFKYHNSALIQPASHSWDPTLTPNLQTTNSPVSPLEIIASPGGHNVSYSWPGPGYENSNNVYFFCFENSTDSSVIANQVLYKLTESTSSNSWGAATRLTPAGMSGQTDITYNMGMVKASDGYVYCYGYKIVYFDTQSIYVARFLPGSPTSWSFWNGSAWTSTRTNATAAAIIVGTGTTTQQNCNISYVNGKYVMVQMDLGFFCDPSTHNVYISTATSPTGPFTAPKLVFTINDKYNGHLAKYYTPVIHPEFNNSHNELLVTYCLNYNATNGSGGTCSTQTCFSNNMDPNYYQIKGIRVPYSLVGL